jgi:predicted metal-dependent peptidase
MSDTLQRVKDARVWLSARIPFLGYVATRLKPRLASPEDRIDTAGVAPDGTLVLSDDFVSKLTEPQLRFLIAHEVLHPAFGVFERREHRDRLTFNVAHDFVINAILMDFSLSVGKGIEFIEGGCLDRQYDNMSAEEVYEKLLKQYGSGEGGSGGGIGGLLPVGSMGGDCRSDLSSTEEGRAAHRGDQSAQRDIDRGWQTAVEAGRQVHESQLGQGSLPARLAQILDEIKDPKVSWQTVLSEWLGENGCKADTTYQRPSRRSESAGEILPGVLKTGLPDVTILWDTSGSMHGTAGEILSEVASITGELGLTVRLIICDAAVHADVEGLDKAEDFIPHISGGGGSDFSPAFDVLRGEGNTSVVVAFTDGYIGVPQTQPECLGGVLWVITDRGVRPAAWGQAIRLTSDGYAEGA